MASFTSARLPGTDVNGSPAHANRGMSESISSASFILQGLDLILQRFDLVHKFVTVVGKPLDRARTLSADGIEELIEELGEEKILELTVLIEELCKSRLKESLMKTD
jgi:hypothetical protein